MLLCYSDDVYVHKVNVNTAKTMCNKSVHPMDVFERERVIDNLYGIRHEDLCETCFTLEIENITKEREDQIKRSNNIINKRRSI
jgi:hypothetical protein